MRMHEMPQAASEPQETPSGLEELDDAGLKDAYDAALDSLTEVMPTGEGWAKIKALGAEEVAKTEAVLAVREAALDRLKKEVARRYGGACKEIMAKEDLNDVDDPEVRERVREEIAQMQDWDLVDHRFRAVAAQRAIASIKGMAVVYGLSLGAAANWHATTATGELRRRGLDTPEAQSKMAEGIITEILKTREASRYSTAVLTRLAASVRFAMEAIKDEGGADAPPKLRMFMEALALLESELDRREDRV